MKSPKNVKLTYLYRDASNYKAWGEITFANPEYLLLEEIEESLATCFLDGIFFVASQVGIPEVFLFHEYPFSEDDHFFHEFVAVESSDGQAMASDRRSIKKFIEQCNFANQKGWLPKASTSSYYF